MSGSLPLRRRTREVGLGTGDPLEPVGEVERHEVTGDVYSSGYERLLGAVVPLLGHSLTTHLLEPLSPPISGPFLSFRREAWHPNRHPPRCTS